MVIGKKISIIGCGQIGGFLATILSVKSWNIFLFDRSVSIGKGKLLDISQANTVIGVDSKIFVSHNYSELENSDVIVVTAGIARNANSGSRDELLKINTEIISSIAENVKKYAKDAFVIVVTNPLDLMVRLFQEKSELSSNKVVGMSCLDSYRFAYFLSLSFNVSVSSICSYVIGAHNNTMLPLINYSTIAGTPLSQIIKNGVSTIEQINEIIERTRSAGSKIVQLLGNGSAFVAPAMCVADIIESYIFDRKKVICLSSMLSGEYGYSGFYIGVPVIIGTSGIEKIIEFDLSKSEKNDFDKSVQSIINLGF